MFTVKVVSMDGNGEYRTELFAADRVSHKEFLFNSSKDLDPESPNGPTFQTIVDKNSPTIIVGGLSNYNIAKEMEYSFVILGDHKDGITDTILITPLSDVYIMNSGKTVDSYRVCFH